MNQQRAASIDGSDSLEGDGLPFYPSQSPSLRRSMGCGRQSNKVPAAEDVRPREVDVRGTDKDAGRGRSRPQLEANRGRQRRTKRQSDRNPWALHRRQRKQGWLIESFSQAISLKAHFWGVWRRDCVASLQSRGRWIEPSRDIKAGGVIVVHEDNLPPQKWLVGRIVEVEAGADGKVRVRTASGTYRRAIVKLAPLPFDEHVASREAYKGAGVAAHALLIRN